MKKDEAKNFLNEFKEFISRGNVIDLAIGVVIGSAFGKIITSIVDDIIMPLIGVLLGGINFNKLSLHIGESNILYGNLISNVINFLIISFCIFVVIKLINNFKPKKEETKLPVKSEETVLLEEIRDLLKKNKKS